MRFSNSKTIKTIPLICFFLLVCILICLFLKMMWFPNGIWFYLIFGLTLIALIYIFATANYFGYDSFGETLTFINRKALRRYYLQRKKHEVKFDKQKLAYYKLKNYILYKSLVLYVSVSKKKKIYKKMTVDITFLNRKKTKLLQLSLNKILNSKKQAVI